MPERKCFFFNWCLHLLWLAEWKAPAPFQTVKPTKNLGRVRTTRMNAVMAREQSKEADHSSAPCKPALGHCQIEARHKRMKKEGRKYSNLLALKVLLDSLWPMITIPIPSIPSLPTHKASLIILTLNRPWIGSEQKYVSWQKYLCNSFLE